MRTLSPHEHKSTVTCFVPLCRWWVAPLSELTLVEDHHTSSVLLSHQVCSQSSPAKPKEEKYAISNLFLYLKSIFSSKNKYIVQLKIRCLHKMSHYTSCFNLIIKCIYSYFDFGFIRSFIGIWHFGPLFLSLSVCLHHATKKGTFVLQEKQTFRYHQTHTKHFVPSDQISSLIN